MENHVIIRCLSTLRFVGGCQATDNLLSMRQIPRVFLAFPKHVSEGSVMISLMQLPGMVGVACCDEGEKKKRRRFKKRG